MGLGWFEVVCGILCILGLLLVPIGLVFFWLMRIYNNLVVQRNRYKNAYSQIDVQLQRRFDLIPNLIETVKGYMSHEKETLEAVVQARSAAFDAGKLAAANPGDPDAMKNLNSTYGQMEGALGRLLMVAESYPDLKANQNMLSLQEELSSTENKVSFARQGYNDGVTTYNTAREVFPAVFVAGMFGFHPAELWEVDSDKVKEAPQVKF